MTRTKEEILKERKEELTKKREESIKSYLVRKESKTKTTKEIIAELQKKLVQCCIDFINEKNLGDLERVDFNADSLQISSEAGEWTPSTDSYISGYELINENNFLVEKEIANYC